MATNIASEPIGAILSASGSTKLFELGQRAKGTDGSEWIYVLANSALSQYRVCVYGVSAKANPITAAIGLAGRLVCVPQIAIAAGEYGWALLKGGSKNYKVKVLASCAPNVRLYTTSTAGSLDDTSASQTAVYGIVLSQTAGASAGAGNGITCLARIAFPHTEATA